MESKYTRFQGHNITEVKVYHDLEMTKKVKVVVPKFQALGFSWLLNSKSERIILISQRIFSSEVAEFEILCKKAQILTTVDDFHAMKTFLRGILTKPSDSSF